MSEVNVDRLISTFCELVKIPSESPEDNEFIDHLSSLFKMMGGKAKKDKTMKKIPTINPTAGPVINEVKIRIIKLIKSVGQRIL